MGDGENPDTHCALHTDRFDVDEGCCEVGLKMFIAFTKDLMDGVDFKA